MVPCCLLQRQTAVEVNWQDQERINNFGKLNHRHQVIRVSLEDKKVCRQSQCGEMLAVSSCSALQASVALQKHLEHLEEAQNELMLVDEDDTTRFLVGECFLHIGNEDADNRISRGVQSYLDQRKLKGVRANISLGTSVP